MRRGLGPAPLAPLLAALSVLLAACATSVPPRQGAWTAVELLSTPGKLGGCAVGDVDAASPGLEAVAVSSEGRVVLARRGPAGWEAETLFGGPGELIQVAVGDVLPQFAGDEVVAVGMLRGSEEDGGPGAVHLLWREGTGWRSKRLATPPALVHAVALLDLEPERPGLEVVTAGFDLQVRRFAFDAWPEVDERQIGTLHAAAKGMTPVGSGVAISCADGTLVLQSAAVGRPVLRASSGLARLAHDTGELLVSSDTGELYRLEDLGAAEPRRETIFLEPGGAKGRGAVIAELDPNQPGLEYATAGYSGKVHLLFPTQGGWRALEIYDDGQPLHHLAAADLLPERAGLELICCGFAGRLVLLVRGDGT